MVRKIKIKNNREKEKINNGMKHQLCTSIQKDYFDKRINLFDYFFEKGWCIFDSCSVKKGSYIVKIPENFSIVNNHDETIEVLKQIFSFRFTSQNKINLDFSSCKQLDLCASTVTLVLLLSFEQDMYRFKNDNSFRIFHNVSNNIKVDTILMNNGLVNYLDMKQEDKSEEFTRYISRIEEERKKIEILKLIIGGKTNIDFYEKFDREQISLASHDDGNSVVEFINKCLSAKKAKLSEGGISKFKSMYGEILDNSEVHLTDEISQFFCIGMFHIDDDGENRGSLVMFNFGRTIYEGLLDAEIKEMKEGLEKLSKHHIKNRNFDNNFDEEVLWTLASLQNKISRCYDPNMDDNRGTGLPNLIDAFLEISKGDSVQKLNIISGRAQISLDILDKANYTNGRITFNESGSLTDPPSIDKAKKNKEYYPGTLISVEFNIASEFVIKEKS